MKHWKSHHRSAFGRFAKTSSRWLGHPVAFGTACAAVFAWLALGPTFGFSDHWQLIINTATTIVTFLMVFLIQNTQNRDTAALQIKLDELIRATEGAHNALLDLEELTEEELHEHLRRYEELADRAREQLRQGKKDTGVIEVDEGAG